MSGPDLDQFAYRPTYGVVEPSVSVDDFAVPVVAVGGKQRAEEQENVLHAVPRMKFKIHERCDGRDDLPDFGDAEPPLGRALSAPIASARGRRRIDLALHYNSSLWFCFISPTDRLLVLAELSAADP